MDRVNGVIFKKAVDDMEMSALSLMAW